MTWTYSEEYYKKYTRDTWNESAEEYEPVARNLDLYNDVLLRHAQPAPGQRILDVACGLGEPALTLGPMVLPGGSVIGVDLSERMVEKANAKAKAVRRDNVRFEVMDAEALAIPDASIDVAVCRFGLQIVTDPDRAIAEMHRVVKPGGRIAASVWGPGERCPAIHVMIGPMLKHAEPDETGYLPTPYEMGGPGELADILRKVGFKGVREERFTRSWRFADVDAYFRGVLKGTPIGHSLSEEDPPVQEQVMREARENLRAYETPGGIELPSEAVVVSGTR